MWPRCPVSSYSIAKAPRASDQPPLPSSLPTPIWNPPPRTPTGFRSSEEDRGPTTPSIPPFSPLPARSQRSAVWGPDLSWCPPPEDSPPPPRRLLGPAALQNAPSSRFRESGLARCAVGRGRTVRCSITSCNSLTYCTRAQTLLPIWNIGKLYFCTVL